MVKLYGIPNCDSVKKAKKWLDANDIDYQFHDFRKDGLTKKQVADWSKKVEWTTLLNKRSTTWKSLDDDAKAELSETTAIQLMVENPTLIKRPVLDTNGNVSVGFQQDNYTVLFKQ